MFGGFYFGQGYPGFAPTQASQAAILSLRQVAAVSRVRTDVIADVSGFGLLPIPIPVSSGMDWNVQTALQTQPATQVVTDLSGLVFAPAAEIFTVNQAAWMMPEPRIGKSYHNGITPADEPVVLLYEDDQAAWTPAQRQIATERVPQRMMNLDPQFVVTAVAPPPALSVEKWLAGMRPGPPVKFVPVRFGHQFIQPRTLTTGSLDISHIGAQDRRSSIGRDDRSYRIPRSEIR